jgi:predicted ATP-dependent serine protease
MVANMETITDFDYFGAIDKEMNKGLQPEPPEPFSQHQENDNVALDKLSNSNEPKPILKKIINPKDFVITNRLNKVKDLPPPKKLLGDYLVEFDMCILAGNSNLGKSIFLYQLAKCLSNGESYWDELTNQHTEPMNVLYFDYEQSIRQLITRYQNYNTFFGNNDNFFIVTGADEPVLDEATISLYIEALKPKLVIIDNLSSIDIGEENDLTKPDVAKRFIQKMLKIRNKYEITMILASHHTKGQIDQIPTLNDVSGGKKITDLADNVLQLATMKKQTFLKQSKARFSNKDEFTFVALEKSFDGNLTINPTGWVTEKDLKKTPDNNLNSLVREIFENVNELRYSDLVQKIEQIKGVTKATAKQTVGKLSNHGLIFKRDNGCYILNENQVI